MVRILSNGEIVADDDPRAQQTSSRRNIDAHSRQNRFQTAGNGQQGYEPQVNVFQALNQRLVAFGIPRCNFGDIVIEPIVSVGLLVSLLVFGIHGLIFGLILFLVSRWSTNGAPEIVSRFFGGGGGGGRREDGSNGGRGNTSQGRAGGGYRLGR